MANAEKLKDLVGRDVRVRVHSAASPITLMGEGRVVAYCEAPSFLVEDAAGNKSWHSSELPVQVETWEPLR